MMKTIRQYIDFIRWNLEKFYSESERRQLSYFLVGHVTGLSSASVLADKDTILSENQGKKLDAIVARLAAGEPLQYVLGTTEFCGLTFAVNRATLIPRPETAELVGWMLSAGLPPSPRVLDIGTGSGCIAVALKKALPSAEITAVDVSDAALDVARENAERNAADIRFRHFDILEKCDENIGEFDVFVSNPPYVRECEKAEMAANVLDFEPHRALFVPDDDPLVFYRAIARFSRKNLREKGFLFLEINQYLSDETCIFLQKNGFCDVELRRDFYDNPRMIKATKWTKT